MAKKIKVTATSPRRKYTKEFKADVVCMATAAGANIAQTARDLGIGDSLLRSLIRTFRERDAGGLTEDKQTKLTRHSHKTNTTTANYWPMSVWVPIGR